MSGADTNREVLLVGISHKTAPVELRECFSLDGDRSRLFMERAASRGVEEIVYVATCNRVEVYAAAKDPRAAAAAILDLLEEFSCVPATESGGAVYKKYSREAVAHLLSVASSLDSMVVGENEILGQLRECYKGAVRDKRTGPVLNRLFHQAFRTAKRVRTETNIARNPLSIAFIAVELARSIFEDLSRRKALLVGAGEMGELILRYLASTGRVTWSSPTGRSPTRSGSPGRYIRKRTSCRWKTRPPPPGRRTSSSRRCRRAISSSPRIPRGR